MSYTEINTTGADACNTRHPSIRVAGRMRSQGIRWACGSVLGIGTLLSTSAWAAQPADFEALVEREGDAVVSIAVEKSAVPAGMNGDPSADNLPDGIPEPLRRFFERQTPPDEQTSRPARGMGSGFIISEDGYIMTNAHVVDGATSISVSLQDRRELEATLVGLDEPTDIALLKVATQDLPTVSIGEFGDVQVGQWVLAIGSPFGLDHSASQGIVSAISRNLPSGDYVPFIQTDVAVNPGNSGGPLFNTDGEVVGVNSQIYSSTGGYQGLSFAIPIDLAMNIADQLKSNGRATRGWLGVAIRDVDAQLAESFGLERPMGALISSVNDGAPAQTAGLKAGDIVLEFDGKPVERSSNLPPLVAAVPIGDTVTLAVQRDDQRRRIDVKVGELDARSMARAGGQETIDPVTGLAVSMLTAEQKRELKVDDGVKIQAIGDASPASDAGLRVGDVVRSLAGQSVDSAEDLTTIVNTLTRGEPVPMLVQRDGNALYLTLQLPNSAE